MWVYSATSESKEPATIPQSASAASLPPVEETPSLPDRGFSDGPPRKRKHAPAHAKNSAAVAIPLPHAERSSPPTKNSAGGNRNSDTAAVPAFVGAADSAGSFIRSGPLPDVQQVRQQNAVSSSAQVKAQKDSVWPLVFFAVLYAFGTAAAGAFRAMLAADEIFFLQSYVQALRDAFLAAQPFALFSQLFLSAFIPVTLVLILSLCAFGVPLIAVLVVLSGMGVGFTVIQLLVEQGTEGLLFYALLMGLYNAFTACGLCLLSRSGASVSSELFHALLHTHAVSGNVPNARTNGKIPQLLRSYVYFLVLIALLCGLCAAFSGVAGNLISR